MYSKLFSSIINSSIWSEDSNVRVLWVTLLAMQDREGYVFGSPVGLARLAGLPLDQVEVGLKKFLAPDPHSSDLSRAPERKGRRIELVDGGWRLLNADHYGQIRTDEDRRLQVRQAVARHRDKERKAKSRVNKCNQKTLLESESELELDKEGGRAQGQPPPPSDEVLRSLFQTATMVSKCPSKEDTIRKHLIALRARSDVGSEKLLTYLNSPEAQGMTVNDWQDHFKINRHQTRESGIDKLAREKGFGS